MECIASFWKNNLMRTSISFRTSGWSLLPRSMTLNSFLDVSLVVEVNIKPVVVSMTREIASYRSWLDVLLVLLVLGCSFMVDMHFYVAFNVASLLTDDSFPIERFVGSLRSTKMTRTAALAHITVLLHGDENRWEDAMFLSKNRCVLNFGSQSRSVRESFKFHFVRQPAKI